MFIAWLAHLFEQITRLKRIRRTTTFRADWRDHWPRLRQLEWLRDQILSATAARLLVGLDLDIDFTPEMEPPDHYGGPCPRTPFEMNRRFLAIARFNADPESAVDAYARRIAKREGIDLDCPHRHATASRATSPALRMGEEATAAFSSSGALGRGRWIVASSRRDGGGGHSCRGPPDSQYAITQRQTNSAPQREIASACPLWTNRSTAPSSVP